MWKWREGGREKAYAPFHFDRRPQAAGFGSGSPAIISTQTGDKQGPVGVTRLIFRRRC